MFLARAVARGNSRRFVLQRTIYLNQHKAQAFSVLASHSGYVDSQLLTQHLSRNEISLASGCFHHDLRQKAAPLNLQKQQVRFRRHDRASAFSKPRPPTKKQRKEYNRRKKREAEKAARHNPPGSRAGPRREWERERWQQLLERGEGTKELMDPSLSEYGYGDALLDDIIGNTAHLTSQPTPEPVYLGHKHRKFYNKVADQMDRYREHIECLGHDTDDNAVFDPSTVAGLPSDRSISNVLRAYRDRYGTKKKPIGIAKALQHLLKDLKIPSTAFGEQTLTTLLTCARTPQEARRIFKLIQDNQLPISAYSWSILVDIHAKLGDFKGCGQVIKEMVLEGVRPTQAAYTSLLAACYKVCNDGRIPHAIRAEAGDYGWNHWQEMIVIGIEPDVMSYGAMIRLCAARGRPERAINLLEEMERFEIKPTTLCFTGALQAVAKSHEIANRFERGWSKKQLRRESIAAHHGKMARTIVIMAENSDVKIDDGFVSSLMLCAAAAGDSATAKAIFLAAEVRKMDDLRTIGPESHLRRLRGDTEEIESHVEPSGTALSTGSDVQIDAGPEIDTPETLDNQLVNRVAASENGQAISNTKDAPVQQQSQKQLIPSYGEREYGKDTRTLSALVRSCARAVDKNGIGTIWAGSENEGYLCEDSLRLITTRWKPKYVDKRIPGADSTKLGISALRRFDEDEPEYKVKKHVRRKFRGLYTDEDVPTTIDELDETTEKMFVNEYGESIAQNHEDDDFRDATNLHDLDASEPTAAVFDPLSNQVRIGSQSDSGNPNDDLGPLESSVTDAVGSLNKSDDSVMGSENDGNELFFDYDVMRWRNRPAKTQEYKPSERMSNDLAMGNSSKHEASKDEEKLFFDYDEMRWKKGPKQNNEEETLKRPSNEFELKRLKKKDGQLETEISLNPDVPFDSMEHLDENLTDEAEIELDSEEAFQIFFSEVKEEAARNGEETVLEEDDARELFRLMHEEFSHMKFDDNEHAKFGDKREAEDSETIHDKEGYDVLSEEYGSKDLDSVIKQTNKETLDDIRTVDEVSDFGSERSPPIALSHVNSRKESSLQMKKSGDESLALTSVDGDSTQANDVPVQTDKSDSSLGELSDREAQKLAALENALPGLPMSRIKKVCNAFDTTLGYPSLLTLVPILRETMPDYMTAGWLKSINMRNAEFVLEKARKDGTVDLHLLNAMLEVKTSASSLDRAVEFYHDTYLKHNLSPTGYSDRLVMQMFISNNRFTRALKFKETIEAAGRTLDIPSYGSLIDHCGRNEQLGSGLLLLKECIARHGAPPSEKYISRLRRLCRQQDVDLKGMVGEDPIQWLRHGEKFLKREMSKKGRRNVQLAQNALL